MKKKLITLIISATALLLTGYALFRYIRREEYRLKNSLCQSISFANTNDFSVAIHPFEKQGEYYVVIPSYWNPDSLFVRISSRPLVKLTISEIKISKDLQRLSIKGDDESIVKTTLPCGITIHSYKLHFRHSKINSIFINTESGNMNAINWSQDKSEKEKGTMTAITNCGRVEYSGKLSSIHGRGNMTWAMHKKPYSIKLKDRAPIFGLKSAKKFNLLANACDETALRNWIMLNTAERLDMPNAIRSAFAVLYLNGHYNGIYQITNKVEIDQSGIDITDLENETEKINKKAGIKIKKLKVFSVDRNDTVGFIKGIEGAINPTDITGGYLLDHNFKIHRYAESPSGFISPFGYPTEIKSPELATREQVEYISNYYTETMEAIREPNGKNPKTGLHFSQYIDIDSYIYYYLCSEVFYNLDAVNASLFMYKDKGGKMFCGPTWDYDISMNTKVYWDKANGYNSFYIRDAREKDGSLRIFGQLYQHPDYRNRLIEIYNKKFLPIVREYYQGNQLDSIHSYLASDLEINDIMWGGEYTWLYSLFQKDCIFNEPAKQELEEINQNGDYWNVKTFLEKRCEFLAEVWANTSSESEFSKIVWDFGRVEQFQHVPTRVSYLVKGQYNDWPRYLISNKKIQISKIVDSKDNTINEGQTSDFYRIIYKDIENKNK